jgi:hypothetical protein
MLTLSCDLLNLYATPKTTLHRGRPDPQLRRDLTHRQTSNMKFAKTVFIETRTRPSNS